MLERGAGRRTDTGDDAHIRLIPRGPLVAFQGDRGAYGELAAHQIWTEPLRFLPAPTFEAVLYAVRNGSADYGIIPVENTAIGAIPRSHAALSAVTGLVQVGETVVAVRHCLLAIPRASWGSLRRVLSHPAALAQCRTFFAQHAGLVSVEFFDTAGAARTVARLDDRQVAAIASAHAAKLYGLTIVATDIADAADNWTRFVVVATATPAR